MAFSSASEVCLYHSFTENIQEPLMKAVQYSFNQGQANEIRDMQPFTTQMAQET